MSVSGIILRYLDTIFYADLHLWVFALKRLMIQWVFEQTCLRDYKLRARHKYTNQNQIACQITFFFECLILQQITESDCLCLEFMCHADPTFYLNTNIGYQKPIQMILTSCEDINFWHNWAKYSNVMFDF